MTLILFILFLWAVCKGIKAAFRPRPRCKAAAPAASRVSRSLAALEALQAQRDLINEQIRDIEEQLDYCPPAKLRSQLLTRQTALLGKLATCEAKISRLCYGA